MKKVALYAYGYIFLVGCLICCMDPLNNIGALSPVWHDLLWKDRIAGYSSNRSECASIASA